jgi:hypothetical protein
MALVFFPLSITIIQIFVIVNDNGRIITNSACFVK